jgi:thioredoxin reductase (NADPH)
MESPLLYGSDTDPMIRTADTPMMVVALCAAWCDTCGEFRGAFDRLAAENPNAAFVWLDIEDEAEIVGEVEVENFPTLAVYVSERLVHFGVSLPQEGVVRRLLAALADEGRPALAGPPEVVALPQRIARRA